MNRKILLSVLLLGIFLFSFANVSATLDIKSFDKNEGKYGKIKINDYLFLNKVDYTLTDYENSLINSWAEGEYIMHKKTHLFTGIFYKDVLGNKGNLKNVRFYIWNEENETRYNPIYENKNCYLDSNYSEEEQEFGMLINDTWVERCDYVLISNESYQVDISGWIPYEKGMELEESEGRWRIEVEKPNNQKVDFVLEAHGKEFIEWAWWNEVWLYKRTLSNLTGNISYMEINKSEHVQPNFGDIRFLFNDTLELNYTIESQLSGGGLPYSAFTLHEPHGYGNVSHDGLVSYYKLDDNLATTNVIDAKNSNNGTASTNTNNLYNANGIINSAFDFDGSSEYTDFSSSIIDTNTPFSTSLWFNTDSASADQMLIGNGDNTNGWYLYYTGSTSTLRSRFGPTSKDVSQTFTAGTWYNIITTFDGTNYNVYIDGNNAYSTTATGVVANDNFYLGYWAPSPSLYTNGRIDEISIYNRTLTAREAEAMYNQGLKNGLVSYYKFDENAASTTVADSHGSNTGTASTNTNNLYDVNGIINSAFDFTAASSEWIDLGDVNVMKGTDYSISLWMKTITSGNTLFSEGVSGSASPFYLIDVQSNVIRLFQRETGGTRLNVQGTTTVTDGNWHHIVFTTTGGNYELYVDGGTAELSGSYGTKPTEDTSKTVIGAQYSNGATLLYWDGDIDEFGIYNRSISASEVQSIYNASYAQFRVNNLGEESIDMYYGNPDVTTTESASDTYFEPVSAYYLDANANDFVSSNDGTPIGPPTLSTGYINGSYDFDGSSDYIGLGSTPTFHTNTAGSISMWVNADDMGDATFLTRSDSSSDNFFIFATDGSGNIKIDDNFGTRNNLVSTSGSLSTLTWYHIVLTSDGSTWKIYVDTVLQTLNAASGSNTGDWFGDFTGENINLGVLDRDSANLWYDGKIDEAYIYDYALTQNQVIQLFTQTAPNFIEGAEQIQNNPPTITANVTKPDTVYPDTDYLVNLTIEDEDIGDTLTAYTQFYVNGTPSGSEQSTVVTNGTNTLVATLSSGNFTEEDILTAQVWAGDGTVNTTKVNLTSSEVVHSPSVTTLVEYPSDPVTFSQNTIYQFNATITDTATLDDIFLEFNGTNYTATNLSASIFNVSFTNLSVGVYNYRWFANNSVGGINNSETGDYTINQASSQTSLIFDLPSPQVYTTPITPTCSATIGDGPTILEMDGAVITSGDPIIVGVGAKIFNCSYVDSTNYTGSENISLYTITKSIPNLTLSGTTPTIYGIITDFTGANCPAELNCSLDIENNVYAAGNISANYSTAGNANYTADYANFTIEIYRASLTGNITGTSPIDYSTLANITANETNNNDSDVIYILHRNNVTVSNPDNTVLGVGTYYYTYNSTGGQNYSENHSIATFTLTVNKATAEVYAYIGNLRADYLGNNLTAKNESLNGSLNIGLGDIKMYLNNTLINSGAPPLFNATDFSLGSYYFNVTYDGNDNYTSAEEHWAINISVWFLSNLTGVFNLNAGGGDIAYDISGNNNNGTIDEATWANDEINITLIDEFDYSVNNNNGLFILLNDALDRTLVKISYIYFEYDDSSLESILIGIIPGLLMILILVMIVRLITKRNDYSEDIYVYDY